MHSNSNWIGSDERASKVAAVGRRETGELATIERFVEVNKSTISSRE
jgi:hypothetical protein